MKNFQFTVGIDVSKLTLDWAVYDGQKIIFNFNGQNNNEGIKAFLKLLKKHNIDADKCLFCMEHTGLYNNPSLYCLSEKKFSVWLESALQIKRSGGLVRGKNDTLDSERIAKYAFKNQNDAKLWTPCRDIIIKLKALTKLRTRLISCINMLKVSANESKDFQSKDIYNSLNSNTKKSVNSLNSDLTSVEGSIMKIIREDEVLNNLFNIATSVVGVGTQTAIAIIITTNEFKYFESPRKYACYAGVVPFDYQSGKSLNFRPRVSSYANKEVKKLLHMGAMSAIAMKSEFKEYYDRKMEEGKSKMLIINSIRNKIIHRVFACIRENRKYSKIYEPIPQFSFNK